MANFEPTGPFSRKSAETVERLPGQLLGAAGRLFNYLGSRQAAQDYTNLLRGRLPSRERQGPYVPDRIRNAPPALGLPTPIVSGIDSFGSVDRRQSDLYRQYAPTPQGQFERYFQSSEMDPYFGAASRGAGAPKDLQAALDLASQEKAPTDTPLSAYYRAQSAAGRGAMPEVVGGLTQGLEAEKAKAMEAWAKANPMLAYREFNKRFPTGEPTIGPTPAALQADEALKGVTKFFPGAEPGGFDSGIANPIPPTQAFNQGAVMDANRGIANLQPLQAAKTSGSGMPAFEPTDGSLSKRIDEFLYGPKR